MVENIVAIELAYINTKHPDFQREAAMVGSLMAPDSLKHSSRSERPAKNRPVQLATNALPAITNGEPEKENLMPKVRKIFSIRCKIIVVEAVLKPQKHFL